MWLYLNPGWDWASFCLLNRDDPEKQLRFAYVFTVRWTSELGAWLPGAGIMANERLSFCNLVIPLPQLGCTWAISTLRRGKKCLESVCIRHWRGSYSDATRRHPCDQNSPFLAENIKPHMCYEIRVHALSGRQGGCSSIRANSGHKGESWDLLPNFALVSWFGFGGWQSSLCSALQHHWVAPTLMPSQRKRGAFSFHGTKFQPRNKWAASCTTGYTGRNGTPLPSLDSVVCVRNKRRGAALTQVPGEHGECVCVRAHRATAVPGT